jgi:hypothetical protein
LRETVHGSHLSPWRIHWDHEPESISDLRFDISEDEEENEEEED